MVGLLKSVGTGEITTEDGMVSCSSTFTIIFAFMIHRWCIEVNITFDVVERILNAKRVTAAPPMAPACGLYLANVKYDLNA
jgi:hypothetical protein